MPSRLLLLPPSPSSLSSIPLLYPCPSPLLLSPSCQAITDSVLLKLSHTGKNFRNYEVHVSAG